MCLLKYLNKGKRFCSGVRVTRSLVLYVCFVDRCLSFCTFSFGHCVVCSSSIYGYRLPLWYLQTLRINPQERRTFLSILFSICGSLFVLFSFVMSLFLWFTDCNYIKGIFYCFLILKCIILNLHRCDRSWNCIKHRYVYFLIIVLITKQEWRLL